jgi:hypothetical protein
MTGSKPKRRWYQFSLRTLLVLVLLASIGLSWLAVKMEWARRQRAVLSKLAHFEPHAEYSGQSVVRLWFQKNPNEFTDDDLSHVNKLENLQCLNLTETGISDAGLVHLNELPRLKTLFLWDTRITDAGLIRLEKLQDLEYLVLRGTQVTDEGIQKLQEALPNCRIEH